MSSGTIEGTNAKIMEKIFDARRSLTCLQEIQASMRAYVQHSCQSITPTTLTTNTANGVKLSAKCKRIIECADNIRANLTLDALEHIESDYYLAISPVLAMYYSSNNNENVQTKDYYRVITSANFVSKLQSIISRAQYMCGQVAALGHKILLACGVEDQLFLAQKLADVGADIDVHTTIEKKNFEVCKCGMRMLVMPEVSELHCPDPACGKTRTIIGAVFRDDQFYPQEGQTTKHSDYDTGRHYRFWVERLQAIENKPFDDSHIADIEYIIARDGYDRRALTCEQMREIIKDSKVAATRLNEHVPLLVKTFGGATPPRLTSHEDRLLSIRFDKAMRLYDIVNPSTGGNKPYYPYFIFKLIEWEFRDQPEKLRLLDYIHLQSRETVIKNDINYEKMAALAGPNDGIVYTPTDPVGRL